MTWDDGPAKLPRPQDRCCGLQQGPPRGGELDAPRGPVEQRSAEVGLEGPDGAAEVRLGEMHPLGRAAEMQFLGDHAERLKLAEVHAQHYINLRNNSCITSIGHASETVRESQS
jgi:hypothetical protein